MYLVYPKYINAYFLLEQTDNMNISEYVKLVQENIHLGR